MIQSSTQKKLGLTHEKSFSLVPKKTAAFLPVLFTKWSRLLAEVLERQEPSKSIEQAEGDQWVREAVSDNEALRNNLLQSLGSFDGIEDRAGLIQVHQCLLTKLIDKFFTLARAGNTHPETSKLLDALCLPFEQTLGFLREFFILYFDFDEKMPTRLSATARQELMKEAHLIINVLESPAFTDESLRSTISSYLEQFQTLAEIDVTYNALVYYQMIAEELRFAQVPLAADQVRERLYFLNFNEPAFVAYEQERLRQLVQLYDAPKQKIGALKLEQKRINQFQTRLHLAHSHHLPSLKEQVNNWINEEVRFLESGYYTVAPEQASGYADKIHTSLSVAKLALIIRLLVVDKIIINRSVAPMLRIVSKVFSTLQKDDVSFGSLETKYHAPDKATINAVKDMLFKWINLLGRL